MLIDLQYRKDINCDTKNMKCGGSKRVEFLYAM